MKRVLMIAACALVVCSCSERDDASSVISYADDGAMRFSAEYPATRATDTAFESDDLMGVFATKYVDGVATVLQISGNHGNNAPYEFDGAAWSSALPIYWEDGEKYDIYAYYPYMDLVSVTDHPFSVAIDQSTAESEDALGGYEASDFLWTKAEGEEQQTITALSFTHRMSKVSIHLIKGDDFDGELPTAAEVFVHNTVPEATVDIQAGYVTKNPYASTATIKAKQVSNELYEAIIVPQRIDSNVPIFELVMEGVSYLVESAFVFTMSTQHNVYLTIDSDPSKIKIEIGGEVSGGWN